VALRAWAPAACSWPARTLATTAWWAVHCILANAATLAGHVVIEDYATVAHSARAPALHRGQVCLHRRRDDCDPGRAAVLQDLRAPREQGLRRKQRGSRTSRLQRGTHPLPAKSIPLLLVSKLNTSQALEKIRELEGEDVALLIGFIERSERGVIK